MWKVIVSSCKERAPSPMNMDSVSSNNSRLALYKAPLCESSYFSHLIQAVKMLRYKVLGIFWKVYHSIFWKLGSPWLRPTFWFVENHHFAVITHGGRRQRMISGVSVCTTLSLHESCVLKTQLSKDTPANTIVNTKISPYELGGDTNCSVNSNRWT